MLKPHTSSACARVAFAGLFLLVSAALHGKDVASRMQDAAHAFLDALDPGQLQSAVHAFDDERKDWHYTPVERNGLSLKRMNTQQRELAYELLGEALSEQGVETVEQIRRLESLLQLIEGPDRRFPRDPEAYFVWIFGDPGSPAWAWRFEGHHVAINATVIGGEVVALSPRFLGANPAEVRVGERKGFRALENEEDIAFSLAKSLTAEQRKSAVFQAKAPHDIFTAAKREISPLPVDGLWYGDMNTKQREMVRDLFDCYLAKVKPDIRESALVQIQEDGWDSIRFGWAGPVERGKGNYYFVQSPSFLIEYDNTQNRGNHIHSVWREFDGDFGEDLIRTHRHQHTH